MDKLIIEGRRPLKGNVTVSGSKNAAVAVIPAAILSDIPCRIDNVPGISDVYTYIDMLKLLGASVTETGAGDFLIDSSGIDSYKAPYEAVRSMRASYYLLGALLGRFRRAEVSLPGGCDFGFRPIDQHIKGFEALGAKVEIEHGIVRVFADKLEGSAIYLDVVSVGATVNLMLAAVKAKGTTIIENAAKEPHVVDTANFLNALGANIKGAGTDTIKIKGVDCLSGSMPVVTSVTGKREGLEGRVDCLSGSMPVVTHSIIPDMIEAGTFMMAAAATKGDVLINNVIPKHLESLNAKLLEMNVGIEEGEDSIRVYVKDGITRANIKTLPYPGFPTDLHPPAAVLLCAAEGVSTITEGIWDSRFQYVDELKRMGARIKVEGRMAIIEGETTLSGAPISATDLRAGAAMVVAALSANGTSELTNLKYIDRGYENLELKLLNLGAAVERVKSGGQTEM